MLCGIERLPELAARLAGGAGGAALAATLSFLFFSYLFPNFPAAFGGGKFPGARPGFAPEGACCFPFFPPDIELPVNFKFN